MANTNKPWLSHDSLDLNLPFNNLPKNPNWFLPKFDIDLNGPLEDHVKKFILATKLMNMQHEDLACMVFPYTFENKAFT